MTIIDAPATIVLPASFIDEVMWLLRKVVVHGDEQTMLFRVVDIANEARKTSTTVKSCTCCKS